MDASSSLYSSAEAYLYHRILAKVVFESLDEEAGPNCEARMFLVGGTTRRAAQRCVAIHNKTATAAEVFFRNRTFMFFFLSLFGLASISFWRCLLRFCEHGVSVTGTRTAGANYSRTWPCLFAQTVEHNHSTKKPTRIPSITQSTISVAPTGRELRTWPCLIRSLWSITTRLKA